MKHKIQKIFGIIVFILICLCTFGVLLLLAYIIKARWFTYLGIVILIAFLYIFKNRLKNIWGRTLILWLGSIFAAFILLYIGRPDLQVSFQGTLLREGRRVAYDLLEKRGDQYQIAVRFVKNQIQWEVPDGYSYETVSLTNSKLEILKQSNGNGKIIYELHGGAYIIPLSNQYRDVAVNFSEISGGAAVAMLDYRVAPDNVFPAALDDAIEGWKYLLDQGYQSEDIIIVGDSAGGNLALALSLYLRDHKEEMPAGIIAISPWADLAMEGDSYTYNLYHDPSFGIRKGENPDQAGVKLDYADNTDVHEPYLSPVYGDYTGFPPMLITVGSYELLESDSLTIYQKAVDAGVDANLIDAHGMFHVYPIMAKDTPEGKQAWDAFGKFINKVCRS